VHAAAAGLAIGGVADEVGVAQGREDGVDAPAAVGGQVVLEHAIGGRDPGGGKNAAAEGGRVAHDVCVCEVDPHGEVAAAAVGGGGVGLEAAAADVGQALHEQAAAVVAGRVADEGGINHQRGIIHEGAAAEPVLGRVGNEIGVEQR